MSKSLGTLLRAMVDHLDTAVHQAYQEAGLDYRPRFTPIVRHLEANGPSTLRDIERTAGVSHSAISLTTGEMERLGFVTKTMGRDARERVIDLSDRARAMLPRLRQCWRATEFAARDLSAELGEDLESLLERALDNLQARPFGDRIRQASGRAD